MIKVSGCWHLIGEKLWVANIGKNPDNLTFAEEMNNNRPQSQ